MIEFGTAFVPTSFDYGHKFSTGTIVLELDEVCVQIEGEPNAATLAQVLDRGLR